MGGSGGPAPVRPARLPRQAAPAFRFLPQPERAFCLLHRLRSMRLMSQEVCSTLSGGDVPNPNFDSAPWLGLSHPCSNMSCVFHMMAAWVALHLLAVTARALERVVLAVARGDLPGR